MSTRFLKDEDVKIPLSEGDWLLVRKHLTAGDERDMQVRMYKTSAGAPPEIALSQVQYAQVIGYLVDWSLTDAEGRAIAIRDKPYETVLAALRAMTPESFREIREAVEAHDNEMRALRDYQKKVATGAIVPSAISESAA